MSIESVISSMNSYELAALTARIQQEHVRRRNEIPYLYGLWFSSVVGVDTIYNLREVKAKDLRLDIDEKYPSGRAQPSMLGENGAVRGIMGGERPFIAVKIEVRDADTLKVIGIFVEVIFPRTRLELRQYPIVPEGSIDNYVTALDVAQDHGTSHPSFLYRSIGMAPSHVEAVRDLLAGKEVLSPVNEHYRLRMVSAT